MVIIKKSIKLDKLNDIVALDNCINFSFIGFDTIKNKDINGDTYEMKNIEQKYYFLDKFGDSCIYIAEDRLFDMILGDYIQEVVSNKIYEHGYPESRLIPASHMEDCEECFLDQIYEEIDVKIKNIMDQYFS